MEYANYYERLVKGAFVYKLGMYDDPAGLAKSGCYTEDKIDEVKCAAAYSVKILNNGIAQNHSIAEGELQRLESYIKNIINSNELDEVGELISEYVDSVKSKYYLQYGSFLITKTSY